MTAATETAEDMKQKKVTENELLTYLDEGWDLVKELKSGKIVIKRELQPEDTA
jgi:hypothetical protein